MHRLATRFVYRAAVLPFATLDGLDRERLRALVAEPAIAEAIHLAAPGLAGATNASAELARYRYVARMAGRATPFGLFAGIAVGAFGDATRLAHGAHHRRCTRLDVEYLQGVCEALVERARDELAFVPNTSLYRAGDRMRYVEARGSGDGRSHDLVAVDASPYLDAVLARAATGATVAELREVLAADPELERDEIAGFVDELIADHVVLPVLAPPVTGGDPLVAVADQLRALPSGRAAAEVLDAVAADLAALDRRDNTPDAYHAIVEALRALPGPLDPPRLFRVDVALDAEVTVGPKARAELQRAAELLHRLIPHAGDRWVKFRERFAARYETREVPLAELLDQESGIAFGAVIDDTTQAPLLAGLAFPARADDDARADARTRHLLRLLERGTPEVELADEDIEALAQPAVPPTVDTCMAMVRVLDDDALWLQEVGDISATRTLGRVCHLSPAIDALTRELARAEEALAPEAVLAEVVHMPEGRSGNIVLRPVLRGHEIPYLGTSGIAREQQISLDELRVFVAGTRVVLWSTRLDREIRPMLAAAHMHGSARSLPIYRFLAALGLQQSHGGAWSWGVLDTAAFLPRVRRGRAIFSRARWRLARDELAGLTAATLVALRERRRLPRWIALADAAELPIDLEGNFAVELLRDRPEAIVYEHLAPAGGHVHELMVPLIAQRAPDPPIVRPRPPAVERRFAPGSEWLYAKLYGGRADAEDVLRAIAPLVRDVRASGDVDRFFFLRYADPDPHLRLRFHGQPAWLAGQLLPRLHAALAGLPVWRVQLDTYERELERYGDIDVAERIFDADSLAVLAIVEATPGIAGREARWRIALRGIDQLLVDLGLDLPARARLVAAERDRWGAHVGMDAALQRQLGALYRRRADELAALLAGPLDDVLAARSQTLATVPTTPAIAGHAIHMHVNRMLPTVPNLQEVVLYDLLRRHYARTSHR